jgi:hypothetical protein
MNNSEDLKTNNKIFDQIILSNLAVTKEHIEFTIKYKKYDEKF